MEQIDNTGDLIYIYDCLKDCIKNSYDNKKHRYKSSKYRARRLASSIIKDEFENHNYLLSDCQVRKLVVYFLCCYEEDNNEKNSKSLYR